MKTHQLVHTKITAESGWLSLQLCENDGNCVFHASSSGEFVFDAPCTMVSHRHISRGDVSGHVPFDGQHQDGVRSAAGLPAGFAVPRFKGE